MKLRFWGTTGSIPAPIGGPDVRRKILKALRAASGRAFASDAEILAFIDDELPFEVRSTYGGNTSCLEIADEDEDTVVLLDGGSGIREYSEHYARSGQSEKPKTFHIFISHLHWDHVIGFPFFKPAYLPGNTIRVYGIHPEIEQIFDYQMKPPWFPVTDKVLQADIRFLVHQPGDSLQVNGLTVKTWEQNHPGKSCGYRFEKNGRTCVYATDCEHTEAAYREDYAYLDHIREADVLIFDAPYNLHDATFNKVNWGHSSNIMGVELAARAGVDHLVLFHHEPSNNDENLSDFLNSTRSYSDIFYAESTPNRDRPQFPKKISLAYDGMVLDV